MHTPARVALGLLSVLSLIAPAALADDNVTATKSVDGSFVQGTNVTYTIVMTNNMAVTQPDNFGNEFRDPMPTELMFVSASASSGTATYLTTIDTVAWDGSIPAGGSVTLTITATINPAATGVISNQGQTFFDADGNGSNESSLLTDDPAVGGTDDPTPFTVLQSGIVSATKSVSGTFVQGTDVTYTIVMTNGMTVTQGDNYSHEFTDGLPDDLTVVSVSATSGTIVNFGNVVLWDGTLAADESVTMTIVATIGATATGTISNQGQTIFDRDGDNLHNESSQVTDDPSTEASYDATSFDVVQPGAFEFSAANYDVSESTTSFDVTVNRTGGAGGAADVTYTIAAGTAQEADFNAGGGTLNFADGETSKTFPVTIVDDGIDETDQTIALSLSDPTNGTSLGAQSTATITIQDDDAPPVFSIDDVTLTEGDSGSQQATFTITRTGETELTATVTVTPSNGTSTCCGPGNDWSGPITGLTFNPSTTTRTAQLTIFGDLVYELDDTVFMDLSDAVNATIGDEQGLLTIINNDAPPVFSIDDVTLTEGDSGTQQATFTITKTGATELTATITATPTAGTASCCGVDYSGPITGTTFNPSTTTRTVQLTIFGDVIDEPDETVFMDLSDATNATIGDGNAVLTIVDNDDAPQIVINDISVNEGNSGTSQASLTVTLVGSTSQAVTVDWTLDAGTATCCGNDFSGPHGTLSFPVGITTRTISATIFGDTTYELDETILVNLANATNATIADDQGVFTIVNDDDAPQLVINDISVTEGNSGTSQASLTVTLVGSTSQAVTVDWTLDAGTATCCGNDFSGPHGTLSFPVGITTRTISATIFGDTTYELDETILVNLANATNATIADDQGVITILNDDDPPQIVINDIFVNEGNSGTSQASLTVTLVGATSQAVTVDWTLDAGTATCCGNDFSGPHGTLNFPVGITTRTISATIFGDTTYELDETILVNLANATNATIADSQGVITILNDDAPPQLIINDISVTEGNSGTSQASLTVTLVGSTSQAVTVDWTLDAGTATCCGNDFSGPHGTLNFPVGITTRTISATIFGDTTYELDETILVNLANATNATIADAQGVITILNDDQQADLSLAMSYVPSVVGQNEDVTYTLVVANGGPMTATNVVVTDDRPDSATFQSVSTTQGSCTTADPVVCSVGSLGSGASATITLVLRTPNNYDSLTNSATATSDLPDPTPASASATFNCTKSNGKPCKK